MYIGESCYSKYNFFNENLNPEELYKVSQIQFSNNKIDDGVQSLISAALKGHIGAADDLFRIYNDKINDPQVVEKVMKQCLITAEKENEKALCLAGYAYCEGWGVEQDMLQSFHYHLRAANLGNADSLYHVGFCYMLGEGVEVDDKKAFESFQMAADRESVDGIYWLASCYMNGLGCEPNSDLALMYFQLAAEKGYVDAIKALASYYTDYDKSHFDYDKGVEYLTQAANLGDASAQRKLGDHFMRLAEAASKAECTEDKYFTLKKNAFENFMLSAKQQNPSAQFDVACCYYNGYGVNEDIEESFKYYSMAATLGHASAIFQLGNMYLHGIGVEKSLDESLNCFKLCLKPNNFKMLDDEDQIKLHTHFIDLLSCEIEDEKETN